MRLTRTTDFAILERLNEDGNASPKMISDDIEKSNHYIRERMRVLDDYGLVERPARGIYTITKSGRQALDHKHLYPSDEFEAAVQEG